MKPFHLLIYAFAGLIFDSSQTFAIDVGTDASLTEKTLPTRDDHSISVSPYSFRFALEAGDQAGGPVRYDTRFPTAATDPNPSSYYHTQVFAGANIEVPFSRGALVIGGLLRKDFAHRTIEGRSDVGPDGVIWTVKKMEFRGYGLSAGWIFGRMYREAPWKASLASVVDVARVSTQIEDTMNPSRVYESESNLIAMSMRGRVLWRFFGTGIFDFHMGPELHIPLYSRRKATPSSDEASWVGDTVDLKSAAAIGIAADIGARF